MKSQYRCCLGWFLTVLLPAQILGQGDLRVVKMRNGVEYIGRVATVDGVFSDVLNPWTNAHQIGLVDDGLRRVLFNINSAGNLAPLAPDHPAANPTVFKIAQRTFSGSTKGYGNLQFGPFNEHGHRRVRVTTNEGTSQFIQGITELTPRWCELKTLSDRKGTRLRNWTMRIATASVPPATIRNLLNRQITDRKNPADYFSVVDFFRESEQYNKALEELSFIRETFPDLSARIAEQQTAIRQIRARQWKRQVEERIEAGQPVLAATMLRAFTDTEGVANEILIEMADLQQGLLNADSRVQAAKKPLFELIDQLLNGQLTDKLEQEQLPMVQRFRDELESELSFNNVDRLAAYQLTATDDGTTALQKLSRALSGWFLGSNQATENFAISQSFYVVRDLVREYLTTKQPNRRREIVEELKKYEGGEPRYLAAMIAQMLPPAAPDLSEYDFNEPLTYSFEVESPSAVEQPYTFKYHVLLPPEYSPYRKYPCIVTLPDAKNPEQQLRRWCGPYDPKLKIRVGQAMRNGYIVVCVDWKLPGQVEYRYSAIEHETVMKSLTKSLRQFSIDTDRVFISGHGFGADAAYDIGIAHPEHWAGIIGISGKIARYPVLYRDHKHVRLPIYSVVGEKEVTNKEQSAEAWNRWLPSKSFFECTVVEYKGRSSEAFLEEILEVFKWTRGYVRKRPGPTGFKVQECKVLRPWDNYFWFFELHNIPDNKVEWPAFFGKPFPKNAVEISAQLNNNQFNFKPNRLTGGATVWLSPEFVDLGKRIQIGAGSGSGKFRDFVPPSRQVLLEDVRGRSDRQRPYWANVRFTDEGWQPNQVD